MRCEDAPRRLSAFNHFLEHLPISERIHRPPKSIVLVRHQTPLPDQPIERFKHKLFPVADVIEDLVTENEISPIDPDFRLVARDGNCLTAPFLSNSAR